MVIVKLPYRCAEFEETHCVAVVSHEYYVEHKIFMVDPSKRTFKSCLTKSELGCKRVECEWYEDR